MRNRLIAAVCLTSMGAVPAYAQSSVEGRVGRLEGEMRAVQRKVFPGGAGQNLQPEITQQQAPDRPGPGIPATSPIADLSSRVSALEGQMATLTGQIEESQNRLRTLEDQFAAYKRTTDARLAAGAAAPVVDDAVGAGERPASARPRGGRATSDDDTPPVAGSRTTSSRPAGPVAPARDSARARLVAAVAKPDSGDAAEDSYLYGYRLWQAKFYPEAEAQLKDVVTTYPTSRRASYAQNLLGRSYLDDGKPSLASIAFYDNYKKMPDGERASESLYYLAQSLMRLNKPADACKVYGELTDVYGAKLTAGVKADVARGRLEAKCK